MADDGAQQDAVWPLPKFYFSVSIGDFGPGAFQEVTGLETESQVIEYRRGNSPAFSSMKMPGLAKVGNVTLRKGAFAADKGLWDWISKIEMNTVARQTVMISLLDEEGTPSMTWTLGNAWPTKVTGIDLKTESDEVAVETMELAFQTLTVAAA